MRQKDVCWIVFPFSDFGGEKHRPALILSNDSYNKESEDILICAITSSLAVKPYSLPLDESCFSEGSLPLQSRLRCDKIMTVHKPLVGRKIGRVNDETFAKAVKEINKLLGQ